MWKERLWQVLLVAILGLTLTMCSRSGGNNNPPVANAGLSEISQTMFCQNVNYSSGVITYTKCDASDDTVLSNYSITHDAALAAGWKLVGPACSAAGGMSYNTLYCFLFHK